MRKITPIELIEKIQEIRSCIIKNRERFQTETYPIHENYTYSARNLVDLGVLGEPRRPYLL